MNVSTTLWGVLNTKMFGINSIRHKFTPNIGFSFTPDLSDPSFGFYDKYFNKKQNRFLEYSRFSEDNGGIASRGLRNSLTYSFSNAIDMALAQDTGKDKRVSLVTFDINGSYNFAADSLRLSDINLSFSTPTFPGLNFSGSAAFTAYDEEAAENSNAYHRVNKYLISQGKGLVRLTNFSLNLSTSFSDDGISFNNRSDNQSDSLTLGDRFTNRVNYEEEYFDSWGDNSPGFSPLRPKWNLNLSANFNYSSPSQNYENKSASLRANMNIQLTQTWQLSLMGGYDIINKELQAPIISINKALHCWALKFDWYPVGINQGFYLRFGINASQLQDLKIEKRSNARDF